MPRKKQGKRADNRYEYKATIGHDINGDAIRKSFYSKISRADAKKQAEEYKIAREVSERTGEAYIQSSYTFSEWAQKWLETYKEPFVDENTYDLTYESIVRLHLIPYFGRADLRNIRPIDVANYFAKKTGCSESRLKKMHSILSAIFEAGIENDICLKNPAKNATYHSEAQKKEKLVYTDDQIAVVKAAAKDTRPEVVLLLNTGIRRGELLGLMWSDYDKDAATLSIRRSMAKKKSGLIANPPKWNSYRTLPLNQESIELLDLLPHNGLYIFPTRDGEPQTPNTWAQKLARWMQKMNQDHPEVPILTAHELRHTYGTMLRRHGADIYSIQKLLGHRDIKVTAEIYVHNEIDILRAVIDLPAPATESEAKAN